jgi:hypothetical protein
MDAKREPARSDACEHWKAEAIKARDVGDA